MKLRALFVFPIVASAPVSPALAESLRGPAEIIDGDTIRVAGRTVRLDGIDAPEARQECEDAGGQAYPCGRSANRFLSGLIGSNAVTCEVGGMDAYDRALGI